MKRSLRHERRRQAPSNFNYSSDDEKDEDYRQRSRTLPVNLSHMMKTTTMNAETVIHLREAW